MRGISYSTGVKKEMIIVRIIYAVALLFCFASIWFNEKKNNTHATDITLLFAYTFLFLAIGMIIEQTRGL